MIQVPYFKPNDDHILFLKIEKIYIVQLLPNLLSEFKFISLTGTDTKTIKNNFNDMVYEAF